MKELLWSAYENYIILSTGLCLAVLDEIFGPKRWDLIEKAFEVVDKTFDKIWPA